MTLFNHKNEKDTTIKQNLLLKTILIAQSLLIAILVMTVVYKTNSQRTVFIPPQTTYKEFWVSGDVVSKSYLEMIGNFVAQNLLSVTRDNAEVTMGNILPLVDSSSFNDVKLELRKMHKYIIENNIARTFHFQSVESNMETSQIIVYGMLSDSISNKVLKSRQATLTISYKVSYGQFYILNLELKEEK